MGCYKSRFIYKLFFFNTVFFITSIFIFLLFPEFDIFVSSIFYFDGVFLDKHFSFISEVRNILKNSMIIFAIIPLLFLVLLKLNNIQSIRNYKKNIRLKFIALGLVLGPIIGCGLIANFYFKDNWGRARPYQIEEFGGNLIYTPPLIKSDQCKKNCSWIGGETSAAFSFLAGLLFLRKKKETLRILFLFGSLVIFCRMAMGGHFLSDNLFAVNLMIYISILYYLIMIKLFKHKVII